jgi:hypothetical protein
MDLLMEALLCGFAVVSTINNQQNNARYKNKETLLTTCFMLVFGHLLFLYPKHQLAFSGLQ